MVLFYKDYFFPVGHVDAGKPVPLGLCGQLGPRPHSFTNGWLAYKSLMLELEMYGYSSVSRNGDDPVQERLRSENYWKTDPRSFDELYRIGLARVGITNHDSANWLARTADYVHNTVEIVSAFNHFVQESKQVLTEIESLVGHNRALTGDSVGNGLRNLLHR
jgi:hypothetical protein